MDNKNNTKSQFSWSVVDLAWQLGYSIAIPLVGFALLGRFLDKKLDSSPFLLLTGILISIIISSIAVYKKTKKIINDIDSSEK